MSSILPKNELENVNFCPSLLGQKFFVRFWRELKKPKSPFQINWPLVASFLCTYVNDKCKQTEIYLFCIWTHFFLHFQLFGRVILCKWTILDPKLSVNIPWLQKYLSLGRLESMSHTIVRGYDDLRNHCICT